MEHEFEITDQIRIGLLIEDLDEQIENMLDSREMMKTMRYELELFQKVKKELEVYMKLLTT